MRHTLGQLQRKANLLMGQVVDTFFPANCPACGDAVTDPHALCAACWGKMEFISEPMCHHCGLPFEYHVGEHGICGECMAAPPAFTRARSVFKYNDLSRSQVLAFKFHDRTQLAPLFGQWLAQASSQAFIAQCEMIIPVPLHYRRLVARRYNQAVLLAQALARHVQLPVHSHLLLRRKATTPQSGLSRAGREANVRGAFTVPKQLRPQLRGKKVLLIDDVMTTGATLSACARALHDAGVVDVYVLTLARTVLSE